MTVIAAFVGGWGHAEPLVPIAALARSVGQHVVFTGQAAVVPRLRALGFETEVVGPDTLGSARLPLVAADRERERAVVRDHFVTGFGAVRAAALGQLFVRRRPDLVVCDEMDVGAMIAAEVLDIPCVTVIVTAVGRLNAPVVIGTAWSAVLRVDHGLSGDPDGLRLGGALTLAPLPRSLRDPALLEPPILRMVRPSILDEVERSSPPPRPLVYVTLGTVFNVESGDLLDRLVRAATMVDADVLVTTGPHIDPAEFTEVAGHVRIAQFVPQREVLARSRAVVSHGGSGTLIAALTLGVPVVVLPMGADQPDNADRCADLGVGVVLDPMTADPPTIAAAVDTVIGDRRYARAAARLAAEAARQPHIRDLPELLALLGPPTGDSDARRSR